MKRDINKMDIDYLIKKILIETEDIDLSELSQYIPLLQKINRQINLNEVILWFNENNVDYIGLNDLEMIIIYIARNSQRRQFKSNF